MRKQIYENKISAEPYPRVTRFTVLRVRGGERRGGKRGGVAGTDRGVEGNLDCPQDYRETTDCEVNRKQRRHLNGLCVREAGQSEKEGIRETEREEAMRMDSVGTGKAISLMTLAMFSPLQQQQAE